jgi:hypothetical protein
LRIFGETTVPCSGFHEPKGHKGRKIAVRMEQRRLVLDTPGGDQTVNRFPHCDALAAQLPIKGGTLPGIHFAYHANDQKRLKGSFNGH